MTEGSESYCASSPLVFILNFYLSSLCHNIVYSSRFSTVHITHKQNYLPMNAKSLSEQHIWITDKKQT